MQWRAFGSMAKPENTDYANLAVKAMTRLHGMFGDGMTGQYLQELHEQLKTGTYQPHAVKRVNIPKASGGTRPLGIPTVKDRVVQMAI